MSTCSQPCITEQNASYILPEMSGGIPVSRPSDARDLFTHQTGQVLRELGNLFIHVPPFNEHVDPDTGALLISIGDKLQRRK
ncbi:MAG TPA: hypothetical protein VK900_08155 [Anaerolineales bacterium]|nr:hypothetical protein [Anaerolineales bacterium]